MMIGVRHVEEHTRKTAAVRYGTGRQEQRAYHNALALSVGKGIRD